MAANSEERHVTQQQLDNLHQPRGGAGGKGCLTRHQRRSKGHLCSHQWQAGVKATADFQMYEVPGRPDLSVLKPGNFEHFKRPYWHNAHHMISNGALRRSIAKVGEEVSGIANVIKQGLLKATYNLNDKINMIILPMEMEYAVKLGLPRHLLGDQVGPGQTKEMRSHVDYCKEVEAELGDIMTDYFVIADDAIKAADGTHKTPDPKFTKTRLEQLSQDIYDSIKLVGSTEAEGKSLAETSELIFYLIR